jgi:hypothetical protein
MLSIAASPKPKVRALSAALFQSKSCPAGVVCGRDLMPTASAPRPSGTLIANRYGRIDVADERHIDAHDPGRAKPLQDARNRQERQRIREHAKQRGDRKQQQPGDIDAAVADDFAERGQRQQRDRDRELVAVDDPDRKSRAGMKVARDGGQGHVGDRAVHHRHDEADCNRQDRPATLRLGQAVVRKIHVVRLHASTGLVLSNGSARHGIRQLTLSCIESSKKRA